MVADAVSRQPDTARRRAPGVLTLKHIPPMLSEEPAYRGDPLMEWDHKPEPPNEEWLPKGWLMTGGNRSRTKR